MPFEEASEMHFVADGDRRGRRMRIPREGVPGICSAGHGRAAMADLEYR